MQPVEQRSIIFFDGFCLLCQSSVRFILVNDVRKVFYFASLQSDFAKEFLKDTEFHSTKTLKTLVLWHKGEWLHRSTAAIHIAKPLKFPWNGFYYFGKCIPKTLRDRLYDFVAEKRYHWFGTSNSCIVPDQADKHRFLG